MAYVQPQTTIYLLKNVPLDNTYDHTVYFPNVSAQRTWFESFADSTRSFARQTYQRVNSNTIMLQCLADDILNCNYLMFNNDRAVGRDTKWFYAFITSIEYENENTTKITYEIDDLQTWFFDVELGECFIEREHSTTDVAGDNLVPENLETGEYVVVENSKINALESYAYIIAASDLIFDPAIEEAEPSQPPVTYIYNTLTSLWYYKFTPSSASDLTTLSNKLDKVVKKGWADDLIYMVKFPSALIPSVVSLTTPSEPATLVHNVSYDDDLLDGNYTARNKKLYTYPYSFLEVNNMNGESKIYPREYFGSSVSFTCAGDFTTNSPVVIAYPTYYKGVSNNYEESIIQNNYPNIPIVSSNYKEWLSQNKSALAYGIGSNVIHAGVSVLNDDKHRLQKTVSGATSVLDSVANVLIQNEQHEKTPNVVHGGFTNSALNSNLHICNFMFYHKTIRNEFAKIIDDYFSMYGYATHRVKKPNRYVRQRWTYCKTRGCNAHGSVPANAMSKICSIYDNGITFWYYTANVGVYKNPSTGNWYSNNPL